MFSKVVCVNIRTVPQTIDQRSSRLAVLSVERRCRPASAQNFFFPNVDVIALGASPPAGDAALPAARSVRNVIL